MNPNKVWCVGLGQGCVLKVVWKGFGRSIKMKENFADLIFQIFWSKTAETSKNLWGFVGVHFFCVGTISDHTTG